jgi:hypothetical protein
MRRRPTTVIFIQQQRSMLEPLNVRFAVGARELAYRHVHDSKTQLGSWEEQLEVAERIKLAKIFSPRHHALTIVPHNESPRRSSGTALSNFAKT